MTKTTELKKLIRDSEDFLGENDRQLNAFIRASEALVIVTTFTEDSFIITETFK